MDVIIIILCNVEISENRFFTNTHVLHHKKENVKENVFKKHPKVVNVR